MSEAMEILIEMLICEYLIIGAMIMIILFNYLMSKK